MYCTRRAEGNNNLFRCNRLDPVVKVSLTVGTAELPDLKVVKDVTEDSPVKVVTNSWKEYSFDRIHPQAMGVPPLISML